MNTWQERVVEEKKELDKKMGRLILFTEHSDKFEELPAEDRRLLRRQQALMELYSDILAERIERFS